MKKRRSRFQVQRKNSDRSTDSLGNLLLSNILGLSSLILKNLQICLQENLRKKKFQENLFWRKFLKVFQENFKNFKNSTNQFSSYSIIMKEKTEITEISKTTSSYGTHKNPLNFTQQRQFDFKLISKYKNFTILLQQFSLNKPVVCFQESPPSPLKNLLIENSKVLLSLILSIAFVQQIFPPQLVGSFTPV